MESCARSMPRPHSVACLGVDWERCSHCDGLEGPELQVSKVLCQLLCLQVIEQQGHFPFLAQAWATHGRRGTGPSRTQPGGQEGQVIGVAQELRVWGTWRAWEGQGGAEEAHRLEVSPRLLWAMLPS